MLDDDKIKLKMALYKVAETGKANFRFTGNQNVIISDVTDADKGTINQVLDDYNIIHHTTNASAIRKNSLACVAMPTCPLALAEAQRYMPSLLDKIEIILANHQLSSEDIIIRMTGCPNGCARSYVAEIGFVGTGPGRYNLQLGGDHFGYRLNKIYKENLDEQSILNELDSWFADFKNERINGERFGDYSFRKLNLQTALA